MSSEVKENSLKGPGLLVLILSTLGAAAVHGYLTIHHYKVKAGQLGGDSLCNIGEKLNCDVAAASSYSELFGIPLAMLGGFMNFFLALLTLLYAFRFFGENNKSGFRNAIFGTTLVIFLTSIVMAAITFTQLDSYCPFCMVTYGLSIITLIAAWMYMKEDKLLALSPLNFQALQPGIILAVVTLAFSFLFSKVYNKQFLGSGASSIIEASIQEWKTNSVKDIATLSPLSLGADKDKAVMTLVEFADFRCGHCKNAAPTLKAFVQANPDVRLEFQAFPLDGACNEAIPQSSGSSCGLAYLAHCASEQDKGWDAHEWIFSRQGTFVTKDIVENKMTEMITDLGLDGDKLKSCYESEETHELIRNQAKLGKEVGVLGTPTIYANNKKLPGGQMLPILLEAKRASLQKN